jgi:hypothetical protein
MLRAFLLTVAAAAVLLAANQRLYLKDGSYHNVREYQKLADRVRYYSTERGDWEELPLDMVDLKRTEEEEKSKLEARQKDAAEADAEEKVEREMRREIERIPVETGVFIVSGDKVQVLKQAEGKVVTNKRRSVLKAMSPIPIVSGKATVEVEGPAAPNKASGIRPEFYMRLAKEERFGIVKLNPSKTGRVVQNWNILPVVKEIVEEMDTVEIFRKQISEGLYKIWPAKDMEPGEYAVIEWTEGKGNVQIWDFTLTR